MGRGERGDRMAAGGGLNPTPIQRSADAMLARIQNDLFDVGADLCDYRGVGGDRLRLIAAMPLARLETEIEAMNARARHL